MNPKLSLHPPVDTVIASAGTGKTTALVKEIHRAIDEGISASALLGTTFTNKAAEELIERTRTHLIKSGKTEDAAYLYCARFGTVNATFGKIVSEFALEAGRSPIADVITEDRQKRMFAISVESAISEQASTMNPMAHRLSIENWEDDVLKLADLVRQNDISSASLTAHATWSWQGYRSILPKPLTESAEAIDRRLKDSLKNALRDLQSSADTTRKTATVINKIRDATAILDSGRDLPWSTWAQLTKLDPGRTSEGIVLPVIDTAVKHSEHPRLHQDLCGYIHGVYETAANALNIYSDYKAANGWIDFVDQEQEALRLLENDDVCSRLRETISHVYVDEFQDTNPIQLALFLMMSQIADRSFWVGDPKQAIYGFRGSDPELIIRAADAVVRTSGGVRSTLDISYRARPGLVDFANRSFGPAFEKIGFASDTTRIARSERTDRDGQRTPIEVWGLSGRTWGQAIDALAEKVSSVLESPEDFLVEEKTTRELRCLKGSDIAILCRTNNRRKELSTALANRGLHVSITRPGLLETPEVVLAVAALRYLVDPSDTLAIAEIAHLQVDGEGQPSWLQASLSDKGVQSLRDDLPGLKVLDEQRKDLADLTPREALEVAMTGTAIFDKVVSWEDSYDRIANLDTLRGLAAQYEDEAKTTRSAATAAGLVAWLANQARSNDEIRASVDPDAVNVLTYHGSKGLEWPMVILIDLEKEQDASAFGFAVEAPEEFDIWHPLDGRWVRYWPWPYDRHKKDVQIDETVLATLEHASAYQRDRAEAIRLLYVGVTRARDYLVLAPRDSDRHGLQTDRFDRLTGTNDRSLLDFSRAKCDELLVVDNHEIPITFSRLTPEEIRRETQSNYDPYFRLVAPKEVPTYPSYRLSPSVSDSGNPSPSVVLSREKIGARIPISGSPDMNHLGEAIHAFLASDRLGLALEARREHASETLKRWGIEAVEPIELIEMSNRLFAYLQSKYPDMTIRAEVPVFAKNNGQRVNGRIDLLLNCDDRAVIIDHKSYPGAYATWEEKALSYGEQLAAYASVIRKAGGPVDVETWVHMPMLGQLLQIGIEA